MTPSGTSGPAKATGDWLGLRTDLHDHGIDIGLGLSQYGQWVASGGVEENGEYGGTMDHLLAALEAFGPMASRPHDRMGVSFFYNWLSDPYFDTPTYRFPYACAICGVSSSTTT